MGRTQAFRRLALATLLLSIKPELGSMHLLQRITQGTTSGTLLAVGFCGAISIAFSAGPLSRSLSGGNAVDGCPLAADRAALTAGLTGTAPTPSHTGQLAERPASPDWLDHSLAALYCHAK